jgi:hypothetical protein
MRDGEQIQPPQPIYGPRMMILGPFLLGLCAVLDLVLNFRDRSQLVASGRHTAHTSTHTFCQTTHTSRETLGSNGSGRLRLSPRNALRDLLRRHFRRRVVAELVHQTGALRAQPSLSGDLEWDADSVGLSKPSAFSRRSRSALSLPWRWQRRCLKIHWASFDDRAEAGVTRGAPCRR